MNALWAKKDDQEGQLKWLPLIVHLKDTMEVSGWLWNHWLSDGQRVYLVNQMEPRNPELSEKAVRFLGGVHDIGKATPAFQTRRGIHSGEELDYCLLDKLERSGFTGISSLILSSPRQSHHSLAGEVILTRYGVKADISSIVGGHHGKPVDSISVCDKQKAYGENYYQVENGEDPIYQRWECVQKEIFTWALQESGVRDVEQLPEFSEPGQVLLSGLIIMADWIASNESYFPLIPIEQEHVCEESRLRQGITQWFRNHPIEFSDCPGAEEIFEHRFGFRPRNFQRRIFDTIGKIHQPGIVIIEAPTGGGKTETALAAVEQLMAKTGRSGLFFGLPTQATSNGIFTRVHNWLDHLTAWLGVDSSIRLCHGKAALNSEVQQIAAKGTGSHIDEDGRAEGSVIVNEWFSGRKVSALDDVVVGTVDHFLLTALKQKHLALRHLGFSRKVVVIDEVHAYDVFMQQYLFEAIRWMGAYHVPVILLSATLPPEQRAELIGNYLIGRGAMKRIKQNDPVLTSLKRARGYPFVSYTEGNEIRYEADFPAQKNRSVHVVLLEEDALLEKIGELMQGGGVVGIIVNTVRRAQSVARQCAEQYGRETVTLLHSSFIATDRVEKEQKLLSMIGNGADRPRRKIIIGTQVIEQSLDIDFDVLISDMCPMDLLIQRIGRLQRHEIERPAALQEAVVYVLGTSGEFEFERGTAHVYQPFILIRTQQFLPSVIRVPDDVPDLIRHVYSQEPLELLEALNEKYERSKALYEVYRENEKTKAKAFRLSHPKQGIDPARSNLIGWLKDPGEADSEESMMAQVRDIRETVEVIAVRRTGEGYGLFNGNEDLSGRIDDPNVAKSIAECTLRLPQAVNYGMGIDGLIEWLEAYNRKYLKAWQSQPWLKGCLGIIFDEDGTFRIGETVLKYDYNDGLSVKREGS